MKVLVEKKSDPTSFQLRRTKAFLAKQMCEADAEREEIVAVRRELAEARAHCDRAEREKRKLMEEVCRRRANSIISFFLCGNGRHRSLSFMLTNEK